MLKIKQPPVFILTTVNTTTPVYFFSCRQLRKSNNAGRAPHYMLCIIIFCRQILKLKNGY